MRTLAAFAVGFAVAGCGVSSPEPTQPHTTKQPPGTIAVTVVTAPKPRPKPKPRHPPVNPGTLPQTHQLPSATTPGFRREMGALWSGVKANSVARAMPAYFPEAAYAQVKAIADPGADYTDRLVGELRLDLAAAHALLGGDPGSAQLVAVRVPQSYAHWVDPNACYNRVGYYEVPNARIVYRQNGELHSFGIASMISWRGVWYVVHLGAVVRSAPGGIVDEPSAGAGESAPSSTC